MAAGLIETDDAGLYGLTPIGEDLVGALRPVISWADKWGAQSAGR